MRKSRLYLIARVTIDHLQKRVRRHASRNPLIVRVLADVGIMREEGEGILSLIFTK